MPACVREAGGARAERWKFSRSSSSAPTDSRPLMTSSSISAAARIRYLPGLLSRVPDPGKRRCRGHALAGLLAVGIAAVIAGPESTYRCAFALISPEILDRVLGAAARRAVPAGGWSSRSTARPSAGPRARTARPRTWSRRWPTAQARSSGRSGVDAKSNEIPAVRDLLKTFADLAGAVLIRCHAYAKRHRAGHPRPARRLRDDLQGQHAALYKQLKELPGKTIAAVWSVSTGHGRRARRTIKAALAPSWIGSGGAVQVAQLRRTVTRKGKKTAGVDCLITSDRDACRPHWQPGSPGTGRRETVLPGSATSPCQEDKSLVRAGTRPA